MPRADHDIAEHRPSKGSRLFWFDMYKGSEFNTVICVEGIDIRPKTSYLHVFRSLSSVSSEINATVFLSNRFHDSSVRGHIWRRSSELELAILHRLHNKIE